MLGGGGQSCVSPYLQDLMLSPGRMVSELSRVVGNPAGVEESLGVGKKFTHRNWVQNQTLKPEKSNIPDKNNIFSRIS